MAFCEGSSLMIHPPPPQSKAKKKLIIRHILGSGTSYAGLQAHSIAIASVLFLKVSDYIIDLVIKNLYFRISNENSKFYLLDDLQNL